MKYLPPFLWVSCSVVISFLLVTESNKKQETITLPKASWVCTEQVNKLIMLNGQPRNTTQCVNYSKQ